MNPTFYHSFSECYCTRSFQIGSFSLQWLQTLEEESGVSVDNNTLYLIILVERDTDEQIDDKFKWEKDNYTCDENILNTLTNHLFDMCVPKKYARKIGEVLKKKYKIEDFGNKSYVICAK